MSSSFASLSNLFSAPPPPPAYVNHPSSPPSSPIGLAPPPNLLFFQKNLIHARARKWRSNLKPLISENFYTWATTTKVINNKRDNTNI